MSFRYELFGTFAQHILGRYVVSVETMSARVSFALSPTARAQKPKSLNRTRAAQPAIPPWRFPEPSAT
jgi:hypothetical protein